MLTASNIGVLFGSQLMGFVGDRYGRKTALIISNLLFGVLTFAAAYSTDLTQLIWLRFFAGFGIGGVIPNLVAINAESSPRRLRATLAIIAVGCVPMGGAFAGFVSAALVSHYGWPILFQIGGIAPIVFALAAIFGLSESIKYMALHESQRPRMEQLIAALRPDLNVPPNARFIIEDEQQAPASNPIYLFRNGLWLITPLVWLLFSLNLMGFFFLISWTPTLLSAAQGVAIDLGARRRPVSGRRHGRRAGAVLVVAASSLLRHRDLVRAHGAGGRLDRLCRPDLRGGVARRRRSSAASWCSASRPASTSPAR